MKRSDGNLIVASAVGAVGGATAAVLVTLCCAGPAVVAVIGAGGALAAARLEHYRPYFLAASLLLLAFGFWRAYRPRARAGACSVRTGRFVRSTLWFATVITVVGMIAPRFWR